MSNRQLAAVYGAPLVDEFEPLGGVWIIFRHRETGELVGPSLPGHISGQYTAVHATLDREGWHELSVEDAHDRWRAAGRFD